MKIKNNEITAVKDIRKVERGRGQSLVVLVSEMTNEGGLDAVVDNYCLQLLR